MSQAPSPTSALNAAPPDSLTCPRCLKDAAPLMIKRSMLARVAHLPILFVMGCGSAFPPQRAPLFTAPLSIEGTEVGRAIIDTGGGYEVMLHRPFGLDVVDTMDVLAFGGRETVGVTGGFVFETGGVRASADSAIVGLSVCECNGVGIDFFRKTGSIVGIDFDLAQAAFLCELPDGGVEIPFEDPPPHMTRFDSAFLDVVITDGSESTLVRALLDTGTNGTIMRRGLLSRSGNAPGSEYSIQISRPEFVTVQVRTTLFTTEGLPDLIIGTDVMEVWSSRWYFHFLPIGGVVKAYPGEHATDAPARINPAS